MRKGAAPISQTDAAHIWRLNLAAKREEHRLKIETDATIARDVANESIRVANEKVVEAFGDTVSRLPAKIAGLSAPEAAAMCREELDGTFDQIQRKFSALMSRETQPAPPMPLPNPK